MSKVKLQKQEVIAGGFLLHPIHAADLRKLKERGVRAAQAGGRLRDQFIRQRKEVIEMPMPENLKVLGQIVDRIAKLDSNDLHWLHERIELEQQKRSDEDGDSAD